MLQPTNCGSASTFTISAATHNGTYECVAWGVPDAAESGQSLIDEAYARVHNGEWMGGWVGEDIPCWKVLRITEIS